ncbi:hypothetical protein [Serinicoccus kebangsaanensis]|uniref:hypothetical protein n=1 Tax=Serinicoccus kebangsaanensis TaxID=2602069 RepID=UPI00192D6EFB|nr:hypothetical protein [Serinicoccus kebangsaanensis]
MSSERQPRNPPAGDPPPIRVHVEDGVVWIWRDAEPHWHVMRQDLPGTPQAGGGTSADPPPDLWKVASPTAAIQHGRGR